MNSRQLVIDIPEAVLLAEKADVATFGRELKVLAAVKLYELGRLTSGRAAELAGMPRVEFSPTSAGTRYFRSKPSCVTWKPANNLGELNFPPAQRAGRP